MKKLKNKYWIWISSDDVVDDTIDTSTLLELWGFGDSRYHRMDMIDNDFSTVISGRAFKERIPYYENGEGDWIIDTLKAPSWMLNLTDQGNLNKMR